MKKLIVLGLLAVLGYYMVEIIFSIDFGINHFVNGVKDFYLDKTVNDLSVANTVTAIIVNFRGFDTLGEVTVLFLAATALGGVPVEETVTGELESTGFRYAVGLALFGFKAEVVFIVD